MYNMSTSLPLGYFPQLPTTVTAEDFHTSSTCGTGIDGHLANVMRIDGDSREYVVRDLPLPSRDAVKAFNLANGYNKVWSYLGERIHPPVVVIDATGYEFPPLGDLL